MSRFHSKYHRHNHHTISTGDPRYPDASYDPIASPESPFQGPMVLAHSLHVGTSASVGSNLEVNGNLAVNEDLTVNGSSNLVVGTNVALSANIINDSHIAIGANISPEKLLGGGFLYVTTVTYTTSGYWYKSNALTTDGSGPSTPWLRAIKVRCVGGGGGGGCAIETDAGQATCGGAGSGGNYAERFITNISSLLSSVPVVVGLGGQGGLGALSANGEEGGSSSFDTTLVIAGGGLGGRAGLVDSSTTFQIPASTSDVAVGDFVIYGQQGDVGIISQTYNYVIPGKGGQSFWGKGGLATFTTISSNGFDGTMGGGGSGGCNTELQPNPVNGGAGGDGIVFIDIYA